MDNDRTPAKTRTNEDYARFYASHPDLVPHIVAAASAAMHNVYDAPLREQPGGALIPEAQKKIESYNSGKGMGDPSTSDLMLAHEAGDAVRNTRKAYDAAGQVTVKFSTSDPDLKSGYFINNVGSYEAEVKEYAKLRKLGLDDKQLASLFREPTRAGVATKLAGYLPEGTETKTIEGASTAIFRRTALRTLEASRAWDNGPFHEMALRRVEAGLEPLDKYAHNDKDGTKLEDRQHLNPSSMVGVTKGMVEGQSKDVDRAVLQDSLDVKQSMIVRNLRDDEKLGQPEKALNAALRKFADAYEDRPAESKQLSSPAMRAARGEMTAAFEGILRSGLEVARPGEEHALKPGDGAVLQAASRSGYEAPGKGVEKARGPGVGL